MALLDGLKTIWHGVKNWFSNDEEVPQTLNEQIENGTINARKDTGNFSNQTLTEVANQLNRENNYSPDVVKTGFLDPEETELTGDINDVLAREKEKEEEGFFDTIGRWGTGIANFFGKAVDSYKADAEAQEAEDRVALGYNPKNNNMLFLELKDRGGEDLLFQSERQKFNNVASNPASTQQEINQALLNFYSNTKGLFRLVSDDYYNDGVFGKIHRRKDQYSQEQLDRLAQNNTKKGDYNDLSFEEWLAYVNTQGENQSRTQQIYESYGLDQEDEPSIDLSSSMQSQWVSKFMDNALKGVNDVSEQSIEDGLVQADFMSSGWAAARDWATRIYPIASRVYAYEKIIRQKPRMEWTDDDAFVVDTAERFRQMEEAAARGINNYLKQSAKNVDEDGQISDTLDSFEGGQSLSDLLSGEVKKLSGEEAGRWQGDSVIDVFQQMANEALYRYERGRGSVVGNVWEWAQHLGEGVGYRLGEIGQQSAVVVGNMGTLLYHAYTPWNWGEFTDEVSGKDSLWSSSAYVDQDFTVGRLIETDRSNSSRTIQKYWLRGAEYIPEVVGNLAPDIVIGIASGGTGAVGALTKTKRAYQALKAAEGMSTFQRLNQAVKYGTGGIVKGIDGLKSMAQVTSKVSPTRKAIGELVDWTLTQSVIDQAMDAQWSAYDTEAYSTQSYVLSALGTLGLNVILPMFTDAQIVKGIKKMVNKDAIGNGGIWDVLEYMSTSNEARENVARILQKADADISIRDLKTMSKNFGKIQEVAKQAYNSLPENLQNDASRWTKELMHQYINEFYRQDSDIAKQMNRLIQSELTNPADIVKFLGRVPGQVSFGPYVSKIKLKSGTDATVVWEKGSDKMKKQLNTIDGGIASKVEKGFTPDDIANLKKIDNGTYSEVADDAKGKYFTEPDENGRKHLTPDGLKKLGMRAENIDLYALGIEISEAETAREALQKLKSVTSPKKKIKDETVDAVVDSGAYGNVVNKVKEIVC